MKNKFAKFMAVMKFVFLCFLYVFVFPLILPIGAVGVMLFQWIADMPETFRSWRKDMDRAMTEIDNGPIQVELFKVVSKS